MYVVAWGKLLEAATIPRWFKYKKIKQTNKQFCDLSQIKSDLYENFTKSYCSYTNMIQLKTSKQINKLTNKHIILWIKNTWAKSSQIFNKLSANLSVGIPRWFKQTNRQLILFNNNISAKSSQIFMIFSGNIPVGISRWLKTTKTDEQTNKLTNKWTIFWLNNISAKLSNTFTKLSENLPVGISTWIRKTNDREIK